MGWWDEITASKQEAPAVAPPVAPEQPNQSAPRPQSAGPSWWDSINGGAGPSAGPTNANIPEFVGEDASKMAGFGTQAAASLPTDDLTKAKYFAEKRGIPLSRYFFKDDRLAYTGDDGKAYFEEPKFRAPTSGNDILQDFKMLATGAGPSISPIAGTAATLATIPEGPPGWLATVPTAFAAGATGDAVRQFLANKITGESKPWIDRGFQAGGAGLEQGAGQLFGNGLVRGLTFLGKTPTYNLPDTSALRDAANKWKIGLTPGEETGNRTLLRRQKILANTTQGEDQFTKFYEGRNQQVGSAIDKLLNGLSREASPRMGAQSGVEGAQAGLKATRQELSDTAAPFYKKAIDDNTQRFWTPDAEELFNRPSMQKAIGAAKNLAAEEGRTITVPTFEKGVRVKDDIVPDWRSWDYMKKALDGIIEENTNQAGRVSQYGRSVVQTKNKLLGILDNANPDYATARGVFSAEVPGRNAVERGIVGDIAKLEGNDTLRAAKIVFNPATSSPEDVRLARSAYEKAGALQNWDDLLRSHLQQTFNSIPDSSTGSITNLGGTFRKAILGSTAKRNMMEAATEHNPQFWNDFQELATVLDATGRAMKGESITAFAQAGQRELADEAKGIGPRALEAIEIWKTPSKVSQYWADLRTGKYAERQAQLLTTPEGREAMKELHKLGPTSAGGIMALSQFLTAGGVGAAGSYLKTPKNGSVSSIYDVSPSRRLERLGLGQ